MLNKLPSPDVGDSEIIFNEFFKIRKDQLQLPNHESYHYYTLITKPVAVMILASTREGELIINREYRHPTNRYLLSCPGGLKMEDESIIDCAKRELLEETGWSAKTWKIIGTSFPFPGITGQRTCFVRAKEAYPVQKATLEVAEILQTELISEKNLRELICSGIEVDGLLCTALFFNSLYDV